MQNAAPQLRNKIVAQRAPYKPKLFDIIGFLATLPLHNPLNSVGRFRPIPVIVVLSWLAQMLTGTDVINATLFTLAILFGLLAVQAGGGIRSIAGSLNLVMIGKFLLIAVVFKTFTWQAMDSQLRAPRSTAEVMALGFLGLLIGTWLYRRVPPPPGLVRDVTSSRTYLALTIVFFVATFLSAAIILISATSSDIELTGGLWGVTHNLASLESFSVVPAMYFAWSSGSKRFLSHPLVAFILTLQILYGILSTAKQGVMEPIVCYLGVGFIRYGLRNKTVWSLVAAGLIFYSLILYPYSQWVRSHGGREGSLGTRLLAIKDVLFSISTDSDFRSMVETKISTGESYLGRDSLAPYSRLAMVGEADRLIAATDASQSYTEWQTITQGLKLMVPSFILPDKPTSGGGNFLAHIAGDLADEDKTTQVSYGVMANLFNAFALQGVFWGSIIFFAILYYSLRIWYRSPELNFSPFGSSIWYILLVMEYEHSLVEAPIGNLLPGMINTFLVVGLVYAAKLLSSMLPSSLGGQSSMNVSKAYSTAGI